MPPLKGAMMAAWARRSVRWWVPAVTALTTFVVFVPSLWSEFVTWDDLAMFTGNADYRGLGWTQLRWMWTTFHLGEYMPVTWMTYAADYLLWGLNPSGYHLTNLLLHTVTALVTYCLALRLLKMGSWGAEAGNQEALHVAAGLAALAFAIHPLRAEPVGWVSARGSVLGGLFVLLATLAYLKACSRADAGPLRRRWLAITVGLFLMSLLSRATSVMLPVAFLVLDVYPLRRLGGGAGRWFTADVRPVWLEKLPFLGLALLMAPLAFLARADENVFGRDHYDAVAGAAVALFGLAFYMTKTFLLGPLSPLYERPLRVNPLDWPYLMSGLLVLGLSVLLVAGRRRWPGGLAAWVWYAVILAPTLGFIPYGHQIVADRYSYVACLAWAMLAGVGALGWWHASRSSRVGRPVWVLTTGLTLAALLGLGVLSWNQVQIWRDSRTLWTHAVLVTPRSGVAHSKLGYLAEKEGKLHEAIAHYRQAAQIRPTDPRHAVNLGRALVQRGQELAQEGRLDEAVESYRAAVPLRPDSAPVHYNLGLALAELGMLDQAVEHYRTALRLRPNFAEAHVSLDAALRRLAGRVGGGGG